MTTHISAFPVIPPQDEAGRGSASGYPFPESGMTLRDHFAGEALKGYLASMDTSIVFDQLGLATECYRMADAMIIARFIP